MGLFWTAPIVALVVVVRLTWDRSVRRDVTRGSSESPLDILEPRYARGVIDRAEFDEKRWQCS